MTSIPPFDLANLESICKVLADTSGGLTGSQIGSLLGRLGISDPEPADTKWRRLLRALAITQQNDKCGNYVFGFIKESMKPVSYIGRPQVFEERRQALNHVLIFSGYEMRSDGEMIRRELVKTLEEAEKRAGRLRGELSKRSVHPDVLSFCRAELLQDNYFHAVLEATKSVAEKMRSKSGLSSDGSELAEAALSLGKSGIPVLAFNSLQTESERSEQSGLLNLAKGMFGTFRNPTSHAPRISWKITEQDAMDLLTLASFLHRRLDNAVKTYPSSGVLS